MFDSIRETEGSQQAASVRKALVTQVASHGKRLPGEGAESPQRRQSGAIGTICCAHCSGITLLDQEDALPDSLWSLPLLPILAACEITRWPNLCDNWCRKRSFNFASLLAEQR